MPIYDAQTITLPKGPFTIIWPTLDWYRSEAEVMQDIDNFDKHIRGNFGQKMKSIRVNPLTWRKMTLNKECREAMSFRPMWGDPDETLAASLLDIFSINTVHIDPRQNQKIIYAYDDFDVEVGGLLTVDEERGTKFEQKYVFPQGFQGFKTHYPGKWLDEGGKEIP